LVKNGFLKAAGTGKDESYQKNNATRSDQHCFIGPAGGMKKEDVKSI
jgi:hypothetical protein